jgi:hypothetical protein
MKLTQCCLCLLLVMCLLGVSSQGQAAPPEKKTAPTAPAVSNVHTADDVDVLRETQLGVSTKGHTGLVWWIPFEFWAHSAEENGGSPEKMREQFKALRDYTVVGIFIAKVSPMGSFDYITPSDLRKGTFLRDSEGQDYAAVADLTGDAKTLEDVLRPILTNAMGRAGENFALLFFPATRKGGKRIADELSKGSFSVVLKEVAGEPETIFVWRTPLTSFSAPRYCPVGKERVHADWDYCPRHGVKLDQP